MHQQKAALESVEIKNVSMCKETILLGIFSKVSFDFILFDFKRFMNFTMDIKFLFINMF